MKSFHLQHPEPDAHLLINGDQNAFFYQAIFAFDEARKAGIQRVLIETLVKPPPAEPGFSQPPLHYHHGRRQVPSSQRTRRRRASRSFR